jgi:hypothetical protein
MSQMWANQFGPDQGFTPLDQGGSCGSLGVACYWTSIWNT